MDCTLYDMSTKRPVIFFDTLKTSEIDVTSDKVYAQGGKGNSKLITWELNKEAKLNIEDALISPKSLVNFLFPTLPRNFQPSFAAKESKPISLSLFLMRLLISVTSSVMMRFSTGLVDVSERRLSTGGISLLSAKYFPFGSADNVGQYIVVPLTLSEYVPIFKVPIGFCNEMEPGVICVYNELSLATVNTLLMVNEWLPISISLL